MRIRKLFLVPLLAFVLVFDTGCNASATASRAQAVVAGILAIAQADVPVLEQGGTISATDAPIVNAYLALGVTLNGQLATCISSAVTAGSKSAAFLACFQTFTNGLLSPAELAQLRLLSPRAQSQTVLWVTAIALGVNVALDAFGGNTIATPVAVGASVTPSTAQLEALRTRVFAYVDGGR